MVKIFIDGRAVEVEESTTVFKAAKKENIHIPHFCYHSAFAPEGSCRMCLVEIEGFPKLELACSTVAREGMKVSTKSERVVEARKGVLEFLLAEHPLDCPICDKAGDCKLQDYYETYGLFESQYGEIREKRQKKIEIGKNLILDQERCILCTRCVRFLKEITKTEELGIFERGIHTEVNILEDLPVNNNYSGNLAEICPVGAITDSDFRFKTRTWFLEKKNSICPLCSRGCNISIEFHRGLARFSLPRKVYRIKARPNPQVNGFWICDFGRYNYSYLERRRLGRLALNNGTQKRLAWDEAFGLLAERIKRLSFVKKTSRTGLVLNTWLTNEELFLAKRLFVDDLGVKKVFFLDPPPGEADGYLLTEERSPNRRGAQELGFEIRPLESAAFKEKSDLVIIFGAFLDKQPSLNALKAALENAETKVLFSAHVSGLEEAVEIALPVSLIAEKSGSLTNQDGIIQKFSAALESPQESLPEWRILTDLAKATGFNFKYYSQFTSSQAIFQALRKEVSFFGKHSE